MTPGQFEDRKEQIWVAFATGAMADIRRQPVEAAEAADKLLYQFELRFVRDDATR